MTAIRQSRVILPSMPTETLIMNETGTFTPHPSNEALLSIKDWAELNNVHSRTVMRWIDAGEIRPAPEKGKGGKWYIAATAMRVENPNAGQSPTSPGEVAIIPETTTEIEIDEPDLDVDEELQDILWPADVEAYLARMPAYIPIRIGARLLGLGIEYVKTNPDKYGVLNRAGRNQATVMPKRLIMRELGLDRPVVVATNRG